MPGLTCLRLRCTFVSILCLTSTVAMAQSGVDPLRQRLALVDQLLNVRPEGEGALLDFKAQVEGLPFVTRGVRKNARMANDVGLKAFIAGRFDEAARAFERGLTLDPSDQEICNNLAFAYFRAGDTKGAWRMIKRTLALAPARASAWANLGLMHAAQGDEAASTWDFETSYRFSRKPAMAKAYFEKTEAEADDDRVRAALSSTLAAIESGAVQNLMDHPRPIGGSATRLIASKSPGNAADCDDECLLLAEYARERAGDNTALARIQSAANHEQPLAQTILGEAYGHGYGVVEDAALSVAWYQRAANNGNSLAKFQLGLAYQEGRGVARDFRLSARWYAEAALDGDREAMNNLGAIYDRGQIGEADPVKAVSLYAKASELGNPQASYNLAISYATGSGVSSDLVESARLYLLSAEGGFVQAQIEVADNYDNGRGVPRDEAKALRWYRSAAAAGIEYAREVLKRKGVAE
ncbi:MAG: tetratricopeptide repeat protein [Dokdonella sp.]